MSLPSIHTTCPNHVSLLLLILLTSVSVCPSSLRMTSLRILSCLVFPAILLSQLISATMILLSASFRRDQHSNPYIRTRVTNALYSFIFLFVAMLVVFHILLYLPNIADARPILRLVSFVHCPSSLLVLPSTQTL